MQAAVGTSLLVIAINSATALAARLTKGMHIDWPVIGIPTAAAIAGPCSAAVVTNVGPHHLTRAFAVLFVAVAVDTSV